MAIPIWPVSVWPPPDAVNCYRRTILFALREVADTLVTLQKVREQIAEQQIAVVSARRRCG